MFIRKMNVIFQFIISTCILCFQIENLVGGDRETFCGEHQPFIWESRGSIIKITYSPLDDASGFSAKYSMQDN